MPNPQETAVETAMEPPTAAPHLDVLIVGAGLSGIGAAAYVQNECPWATYAIFEARDAIGGTWDLFRYPGIRSDSDMFTLGYSFRPWDGDQTIADGASILEYIRATSTELDIDRHIRFHHRIVAVSWSTADARWTVTAERSDPEHPEAAPTTVTVTCGFIFSCSGYYRYDHGYTPEFAGIDDYRGTVVHPQHWPEDLDYADKRVVVIGSGATAVTLVPSLAPDAAHVTMLQRTPTYIASLPGKNPAAQIMRTVLPKRWSGWLIRWVFALATLASFKVSRRFPRLVKRTLRRDLTRRLPAGYDVSTHFTPPYDPWDQRLCLVPDGDLFRAISDGSASVVTDRIDRFTETGILLQSGRELDADIVVTATGLELLFLGGMSVTVDGELLDISTCLTYKGMMLEGVPNMAMAVGYTNASWTLKVDLTCDHVCRMLNHMRDRGLRQCVATTHGAPMTSEPLLGLTSGYVTRAADRLPRQGSAFPWRVYQSYTADYRALKMKSIEDPHMVFSNPVPRSARRGGPTAILRSGADGTPSAPAATLEPSGVA